MTVKNLKIIAMTSVAFLCWRGLGLSQDLHQHDDSAPATIKLTLQKAEELALSGNPHIHAAEARAKAASRQVSQTLSPADPVVMIDRTGQAGSPLNFTGGTEMWMVEENLGFPGKSIAKADADGAEAKRMGAEAQNTRRMILMQARQTYWEFYYRQKVSGIQQDAQGRWKALSQALKSRELSGQWLSMKAVRMQMETAKAANEIITTSRSLRVSELNLNHLFSLPHGTTYILAEGPVLRPFTGEEEDYVRKALGQNPEVSAYQRAAEVREARKGLAALEHLPDFTVRLSGTRDPNGSGFSDYGFRLGVSVPLFFPFKQTQAMDQASEEVTAARYDLTGKQSEVTHMVEEAYVQAESAWRMVKLYEEGGLLRQTQRAWEATQAAYRNEEVPLSEFVESYKTYLETLTGFYQAQADYGKALAELEYEVGEIPQGDGK